MPPLLDVEGVGMNVDVVDAADDLSVRELSLLFESITLELVSPFRKTRLLMGALKIADDEINRTCYRDKISVSLEGRRV